MKQKLFAIAVVSLFAITLVVPQAFADGSRSSCSYAKAGKYNKQSLDQKVFHKVHFLKQNKEELNLTDDQVKQLWDIKMTLKKDSIMKNAEIEVIKLDAKSMLYERTPDVAAIDALVDKKYDIKRAKAKAAVQAIADLKAVLTDEQYDAMKKMYHSKKQGKKTKK